MENETLNEINNTQSEPEVVEETKKPDDKKMKYCKFCGAEMAKNAKICPKCGGKNKKPVFKRVSFWLIIAVIVIFIIAVATSGSSYTVSDDAQNMTKKEYKAACEEVAYKELARNTEEKIGDKVKLEGEVQQVAYDSESGESEYLVAVTKDEYDFYTDNIYLYYNYGDGDKILEDDIITIYGEVSGEESYTSILGDSITIPSVTGVYVKIK